MFSKLLGTEHNITLAQEYARAVIIFAFGLVMLRLSGRRTFAQWSALATSDRDSWLRTQSRNTCKCAVRGHACGSRLTRGNSCGIRLGGVAHSRSLSKVIEGAPVRLGEDGNLCESLRKRHLVSMADLGEASRQRGIEHPSQAKSITLEPSGHITVIKS